MRNPDRIDPIIDLLRAAWHASPDLRLGQLISNAHALAPFSANDLFYAEDVPLAEGIQRVLVRGQIQQKLAEDKPQE